MTVSPIRPPHTGMHYIEFMSVLSQKRRVRKYVEIGVEKGLLLGEVHAEEAYGRRVSARMTVSVSRNNSPTCDHAGMWRDDRAFGGKDLDYLTPFDRSDLGLKIDFRTRHAPMPVPAD